jgi:hypothetical protein
MFYLHWLLKGHRYWDLAKTLFARNVHGVKITGTKGNFSYTTVLADDYTRYYEARYNIFPVPEVESLNNLSIVQNSNW